MANKEQLEILRGDVHEWNEWRRQHPRQMVDLSEAGLSKTDLSGVNLSQADMSGTKFVISDLSNANLEGSALVKSDLSGANLSCANLTSADLSEARLYRTNLYEADLSDARLIETMLVGTFLSKANLRKAVLERANMSAANLHKADVSGAVFTRATLFGADLSSAQALQADFSQADLADANLSNANLGGATFEEASLVAVNLSNADLSDADLSGARLVRTKLDGATLIGCSVFGSAVWDVSLLGAKQMNLVVTEEGEAEVTVDNLKIAQFVNLLLSSDELRSTVQTITHKGVLILGRFTEERKAVLDAIRSEVRKLNYIPMMFDFDRVEGQSYIETVNVLAAMCRLVIADITDPKVVLEELQAHAANFANRPIQRILWRQGKTSESALVDFANRPNFLDVFVYEDTDHLLKSLPEHVFKPGMDYIEAAERKLVEAVAWVERHNADAGK